MRSRNKIYNPEGIYFVTSTIVEWLDIFYSHEDFQLLIGPLDFYIKNDKLNVYAHVIMKNHFHMICKAEDFSKVIGGIKSFSAKGIINKLEKENKFNLLEKFSSIRKQKYRNYQIWQETFYPKEIFNNLILKQKIEYIHYNPVRKNYCENPTDWKYSSAKFYETGEEGLIKIERII